jgi:hypothetical protein
VPLSDSGVSASCAGQNLKMDQRQLQALWAACRQSSLLSATSQTLVFRFWVLDTLELGMRSIRVQQPQALVCDSVNPVNVEALLLITDRHISLEREGSGLIRRFDGQQDFEASTLWIASTMFEAFKIEYRIIKCMPDLAIRGFTEFDRVVIEIKFLTTQVQHGVSHLAEPGCNVQDAIRAVRS